MSDEKDNSDRTRRIILAALKEEEDAENNEAFETLSDKDQLKVLKTVREKRKSRITKT